MLSATQNIDWASDASEHFNSIFEANEMTLLHYLFPPFFYLDNYSYSVRIFNKEHLRIRPTYKYLNYLTT